MPEGWSDRLSAVAQNLLTLEVNTFTADGLSAQKMPEIPLALHTLVQAYADYLGDAGFPVTIALLQSAAARVAGSAGSAGAADALLRQLQGWRFPGRNYTPNEGRAGLDKVNADEDRSGPETNLTNGPETFEALQWAAWAALQTSRAGTPLKGSVNGAVLSRINANSRQIKEAALRLEKQHDPVTSSMPFQGALSRKVLRPAIDSATRLGQVATPPAPSAVAPVASVEKTAPRLFGGTLEQTARALFDHPRPVFTVDPDVTILVRKAWDLGTKCVCLQTVLQVDGDVMQVIGRLSQDERAFLALMHKEAVRESVTQWRALFDLVRLLAGDIGKIVFGR